MIPLLLGIFLLADDILTPCLYYADIGKKKVSLASKVQLRQALVLHAASAIAEVERSPVTGKGKSEQATYIGEANYPAGASQPALRGGLV